MNHSNPIKRYLRLITPSLGILAICYSHSVSSGGPASPAQTEPAASLTPSREIDTTRINPVKARDITVTTDNWREVLVRLNNIYIDPGVLEQRNAGLAKFVSRMEDADRQPILAQRDAIRKMAVKDLAACEDGLRKLAADGPPTGRDEAAVALVEVQWMAAEYKAAIAGAVRLTEHLAPGFLRDQACYYLIRSCAASDAATRNKYASKLPKLGADAESRLFTPMPPLGLLRSIAFQFEMAQQNDDLALEVAGTPFARAFITARDEGRKEARTIYEECKDLKPDPAQQGTSI